MKAEKLIFVYNADDGVLNSIMDAAHKLFAPSTYQCALCVITHGALTMRSEWKEYMSNLPYETRFYYRDSFRKDWPTVNADMPAIFFQTKEGKLSLLVPKEDLESISSVAQLAAILGRRMAQNKQEMRDEIKGA